MSKIIILILIISLHLSCIVCSNSDCQQLKCEKQLKIEECYDLEQTVTCAYYKEDCPFDICGKEVGNACYACADNTTVYYKNGSCDPKETVNKCYDGTCDSYYDPQLITAFEPVCGIQDGGVVRNTFDNICKSCTEDKYDWYQNGPCSTDIETCKQADRNNSCTKIYSPVCARTKVVDNSTQFITAPNECTACSDSAVEYYIEGECGPLRGNSTYCLPNSRPLACTYDYNPVCGFYFNKTTGVMEHKVLSNACSACSNADIIYHIPGPCVFNCIRSEGVVVECIGSTVEPICGTYEENGKAINVSLKNQCVGCHYAPDNILVDTYTDGLCPGDEGIYCVNDAGGFLQGIISPVCGIQVEGCGNSSCRTTFSEPLTACADNTTLLYKKGLCPGDDGISCKSFRKGSINDENASYLSGLNYGKVCGYTEVKCEDEKCKNTFNNQTDACSNESVIFFTAGSCLE